MKKTYVQYVSKLLGQSLLAVLAVAALTALMLLIGRDTLGEAVIALLYLLPVALSAARAGRLPAAAAALSAALAFDFLFIPPFYTFAIARLEGWLVLAIFLGVALVVVGCIQESLERARQAVFMAELAEALAGLRTSESVALTLARYLRQLFFAQGVQVVYDLRGPGGRLAVAEPAGLSSERRPDLDLPVLNATGLIAEIRIWRGDYTELPAEDSRLMQNFAQQAARAFERVRPTDSTAQARKRQ